MVKALVKNLYNRLHLIYEDRKILALKPQLKKNLCTAILLDEMLFFDLKSVDFVRILGKDVLMCSIVILT
jgi:hypothetical protein